MMQQRCRKNKGFTTTELLIAMVIFGIVIALASGAVVQYLHIQSDQEAITSAQSKLRRVTELVTQELRSAVLGSITNSPYASDHDSVSFLLLDGGAGYSVLPPDSGNNADFPSANSFSVSSSAADTAELGIASGNQLLMLNADGNALLFNASNPSKNGTTRWRINQTGGCRNTITYTPGNTLLFKVRTFALRHDNTSKELKAVDGPTPEQTLAFNITEFRIDYIYNGVPQGTFINSTDFERLQVVASTTERSRGREIERTYSSQIEIPNSTLRIGALTVCP
jgi:prepilin-type N-terminal cleavage/methylation domain-containing protein